MSIAPSASYRLTVRVSVTNRPRMLGQVASAIGAAGGDIGAVDLVESSRERVIRDLTIKARDIVHAQEIVGGLKRLPGARVINVSDRTFLMHLGGKIEIHNKVPICTRDDLSMAHTPGAARVCLAIYPNLVRYADGRPVYVDVFEEDGFQFTPEAIQARLGPRTRAVVVNSPANPTGTVLAPARMAAIAELGPLVVSDEIYHGLSYEERDRTILEFTDRAFVLNGFSKAFAMTGWRLGYVIAPRQYIRALQKVYQSFFISTNEFVQWAGVAALREAKEDARRFRRVFDERRRAMIAGVRRIGLGVGCEPTGAFYVFANARRYTADSRAFAFEIVDRAHVGVTPGIDFGTNAEGYLRFSYASSIERIEEGLRRLGGFLAQRERGSHA